MDVAMNMSEWWVIKGGLTGCYNEHVRVLKTKGRSEWMLQ